MTKAIHMNTVIRKWGNSPALRLPTAVLKEAGLLPKTVATKDVDTETLAKIRSKAGEILEQIQINTTQGDSQSASINGPSVPKSSGTGVIISHEGLLVTAAHVVEGASKLVVMLPEGAREARLVETDPKNDLAILRLDASGCSAAPLAPSREVKLGQAVFTIGFPNTDIQGSNPKFTKGEISSELLGKYMRESFQLKETIDVARELCL
jgi:S1-C subfamily serine protease